MRRVPIRMKLAAALMVPLVGLIFVTVIEVADTAADVHDVRDQTDLARASVGPSGVITSLQNERTWAIVELIGQETAITPPVAGYDETRTLTDDAIAAFRETLEDQAVADNYSEALAGLDRLSGLRQTIDANTAPRDLGNVPASNEVYAAYSELITPFLDANSRVALAIDDAELRQATSLVDTTTRQLEVLAELARSSILEIVVGGGLDERPEISKVAQLRSKLDTGNETLLTAPPPFHDVIAPEYPEEMIAAFSAEIDKALASQPVTLTNIMDALDVPADAGYMGVRNALVESLEDRADQLNDEAEARRQVYLLVAAVTLLVAVGLTWVVSRSITRPLRSLTRQAKDMADNRLPDAVTDILETPLGENITVPQVAPVRVRTRDEVSDVADALNTVQDTALDLAVEQAVLRRNIADSFVNLGRRNQNLLGRQLDFITELESNETSPDALSNLFRLDHLATRMRRNAESLLVLAGIEPPRQWAAPVRLTDVIRAALGEVEDYQRVTVRGVEPATIVGSAAADLAHLLAELVENALVFSPPDQSVDIRGRARDEGSYDLAVIDSGLGMPTADITNANRRLAGAESFTIAPSKYLGHYVAGNLAARHGIHVRLDSSRGHGITVTLTLPPHVLTAEPVTSAPVTPPHGHRVLPVAKTPLPAPADAAPPDPAPPVRSFRSPDARAVPPLPATPMAAPPAGPAVGARPPGPRQQPPPAPSSPPAWAPPPAAPPFVGTPPAAAAGPAGGLRSRAGGPPLTGGPRATRMPDTALGRTPGGLVRRMPGTTEPAAPAPAHDRALLETLGRYAPPPPAPAPPPVPGAAGPSLPPLTARHPGTGAWPAAPGHAGGPAPSAVPVPAAAFPAGTAPPASGDALTRRVPGAQLPQVGVVPLRRPDTAPTPTVPATTREGTDALLTPRGSASRATDVQALLSSFTAGVQRGIVEAHQRAGHRTLHPVPGGPAYGDGGGRA